MAYGSFRGLGILEDEVDQYARQIADYAGQLMEEQMVQRMPGIISQLQPSLNASATKAMQAAMKDEAFKRAISSTEGKVTTYGMIGVAAVILGTSALTWYLVKG